MNRLPLDRRASLLGLLVEGNSLRAASRLADVSINTVSKLLVEVGSACVAYHDEHVQNLQTKRVQCDEIWSFVGAKEKNTTPETKAAGWGDIWTWTALDADSKLMISYRLGDRSFETGGEFMRDVASRLANRVQLTTDGHRVYLDAVDRAFGATEIDYAQLHKIYANAGSGGGRYSPPVCIGCKRAEVHGTPDPKHISTSYVERQNLTMRMSMRRFTRLTNAFSKKVENHAAMVALHFQHYNFARVHKTLRITPAMAAGISDHVWGLDEIARLAN